MRQFQIMVVLLACAFAGTAQARYYRCVDANGKFNYRDRPCPENSRQATRQDRAGPGGTFSSVGQSEGMRELGRMEAEAATQRQHQEWKQSQQDGRLARKQAQIDGMHAPSPAPSAPPKRYTPDGQHEIQTVTRDQLPGLLDEAREKGRNRSADPRSIETGLGTYKQNTDGSYRGPGGERCSRNVDSMACGTYFVPLK